MAWFSYQCKDHGQFKVSLPKREKNHKCPKCQIDARAIIKGGGLQVLEHLDNGAMARSIDRLVDIEQIMEERSDKHSNFSDDNEG